MSEATVCRLCLNTCSAYEVLSENGHRNKKYGIIRKYFDTNFLNGSQRQHLQTICLDCWRQVNDFYHFQIYISNISVAEEFIGKESKMPTNPMKRTLNSGKKFVQRTTWESYSTPKTFQHNGRSSHRLPPETIKNNESENFQNDFDFSNINSNQNNLSIEEEIDISFSELESVDIQSSLDEQHIQEVAKLKLDSLRPQLAAAKTDSEKAYLNQQIEDNLRILFKYKPMCAAKRHVDSLRQQLAVVKTEKEKAFIYQQIEENQSIIKERRRIERKNNRKNRTMRLYGKCLNNV